MEMGATHYGFCSMIVGNLESFLPLAEFAYNNRYQSSIKMTPYEALYDYNFETPLCWTELNDEKLIGIYSQVLIK
ncbi:Transposon Ty3-I Gag-Pol polyprotein [Gossypium australe]|uniref:Transposon Ty3-I Gag-Pol polyprotein n=1 Tax=Gossypium australe TaxID=47621 RepID=A0A5B6VM83_9ROSI|nr:Transposon Ty3-I Gag-Pol polyprotein [Gossypium australe]